MRLAPRLPKLASTLATVTVVLQTRRLGRVPTAPRELAAKLGDGHQVTCTEPSV